MRGVAFGLLLLCTSGSPAEVLLDEAGELNARAEQLPGGEYLVRQSLTVGPGQVITAHLRGEFDGYLALKMPDGRQFACDNHAGTPNPKVTCLSTARGTATLLVTSAKPRETGTYHLFVEALPLAGPMQPEPARSGALAQGDSQLRGGEYVDRLKLPVSAGDVLLLSLQSSAFDTYLIASAPGSPQTDADNTNGSNSQLCLVAQADGEADLIITSAKPGESGAYRLYLKRGQLAAGTAPSLLTLNAELHRGLGRLKSGEYASRYEVPLSAGQAYEIELQTEGFNGYLITNLPGTGQQDGKPDGRGSARLQGRATADGTLAVIVTSAQPNQTGPYRLAVRSTPFAGPAATQPVKPPTPQVPPPATPVEPPAAPDPQVNAQLRENGKPLDANDPALRLPRLKPTPALVDKPGLLGEVLHPMNRISIDVDGKHTWIQSCTWPDGDGTKTSSCSQDDPRFDPGNFKGFMLSNSGALGWPWGGEPDIRAPESNLHWDGDVFTAFRHVHSRKGWAVVDVVGRVSADGSRIVQVQLRTTAEKWTYPDGDGGGPMLEARYWQGVGLTDLPLYTVKVTGYDANGNQQIGYENPTLPKLIAGMMSYERGRLGHDGLHYGVPDSPDVRNHILELKHLSLEPYRGQLFEWNNSRVIEYRETAWLEPERKPSVRLTFERR